MPSCALTIKVNNKLSLKKPTANHPLPIIVLYASDDGQILGNLGDAEYLTRAEQLIKQSGFGASLGESVSDYALHAKELPAISVIGVGKANKIANNIAKIAAATYAAIKSVPNAAILWGDVICQIHFTQFVTALIGAGYRFEHHKSKPKDADKLRQVNIVCTKDGEKDYQAALQFAQATASGIACAKDVANEAPNLLTPSELAKKAKQLAKDYENTMRIHILGEKEMQKLGMGCFLAVSQGSDQEGKLAVIEYYGKSGKNAKKPKLHHPIALVGKGLTFDTGGISLKHAAGMEEMKFDMGGAASILGTMRAVAEAGLKIDIVAVLACAENMPSARAARPGDVVTAMNGTSVEILNTDAEGRLVLCDTLCYVQEHYDAKVIIDTATLTGACVIALGSVRSGLYSNDEDTLFALESASEYTNDLVWHMPLDDSYDEQINSKVADIQNIGGREAGSVTAACFLQRFIKEGQAWAHLDIAGTAWKSGGTNAATGRPVALLAQYIRQQTQG
ncbi:leucyl aminopeptidase [Moraxella marmotae]|uniref:leucyl aminopeptidase n=1 Tax=Moraxella marmotae TaxID=3344520 RepID=UPI0035F43C50